MNAQTETKLPAPLMAGGVVTAIVPQSLEEMWRISTMVIQAGIAPKALVDKKSGVEAQSSVAIAIMAGAELGLPPMVALRSFTVIGGKPALYGDGLINVCRRSKKAALIKTGYLTDASDRMLADINVDAASLPKNSDARTIGYCRAKRSDTQEEKTEIFSIADAKRAGLWDTRDRVKKKNFKTNEFFDAPNESPWHRYPQRMLSWRAAGYCLRDLFADVLGGITDEFEAREIAGEMRDITPVDGQPARREPPAPPGPPSPPKPPLPPGAAARAEPIKVIDHDVMHEAVKEADGEAPEEETGIDYGDYFERLQAALDEAADELSIEVVWSEFDAGATFEGDDDSFKLAEDMKIRRLVQLSTVNAG